MFIKQNKTMASIPATKFATHQVLSIFANRCQVCSMHVYLIYIMNKKSLQGTEH